MERLRETMKEANAWKEKVEEKSYLWRDDRKEHMRQFLVYGRSLEGLANLSFPQHALVIIFSSLFSARVGES